MNIPMNRPANRRFGAAAVNAPRWLMSWEDWLTFSAALIAFVAVGYSIQQANWVRGGMPPVIPTMLLGLLVGLLAARVRAPGVLIHPVALALGIVVVALMVQQFAEGDTIAARLTDFRVRMRDWFEVVRAGDISNDTLPFVTLVHSICFLSTYLAAYAVYRWHNPWVAILPGGIVLLANIALQKGQPSGAFLVFLFGAIILIARLHLQRSQSKWKKEGIDYPEFISLSAGQLTLFVTGGLLLFAWLMPIGDQYKRVDGVYDAVVQPFTGHSGTFTRLFHNVDAQNGGRLHNFGDFLTINGNIKLGTRELYQIKAGQAGLVRGTSYDEYTGAGWKTSDRDETKIPAGDLAASAEAAQYEKRVATILQVTVKDGDNSVLSSGVPLGTNIAVTAESPRGFRGDIEQLATRRGLNSGDTYNSIGSESVATPRELATAGTAYPDWVKARYLQLPNNLPKRVVDLSKQITAPGATPYDKTKTIEDYLRALPYDLQVEPAPAGRDVVDWLLFDLKRGYFDTQSSAMAVMLRAVGIPSRVAVGYVLDKSAAIETTYTVRKSDAYSWVEVYFPKYGWVTFNPTQDRPSIGVGGTIGGDGGDPNLLPGSGLEGLFQAPDDLLGDQEAKLREAQAALAAKAIQNDGPPWILIWSLAGALAAVAVAGLSGRLAWNWGLGGLHGDRRLWAKTQRFAGWARLGGRESETAREWSRRVGSAIERPDEAKRLAEAYEETRYGRPDLERSDPEATKSAYIRLRNTLLPRVFRRK